MEIEIEMLVYFMVHYNPVLDITHTETVGILLHPSIQFLSVSPCSLLFFIQRQQICPPCHSGGPGARNHGFSPLRPIWTAIQA